MLLIDELDKSEADLPNDLLSIFEDAEFTIPELARIRHLVPEVVVHTADPGRTATVLDGRVKCRAFPVVVMTSNGEREFPPAFLRRCLHLEIQDPNVEQLAAMVADHMLDPGDEHRERLVREFVETQPGRGRPARPTAPGGGVPGHLRRLPARRRRLAAIDGCAVAQAVDGAVTWRRPADASDRIASPAFGAIGTVPKPRRAAASTISA